jgi:ABC-2 type transport system ATP-binding protein
VGEAIAFRSVSKRFRNGTLALADATWTIQDHARACLLGPAGCGKSTAVHLLEGALEPTGGTIALLGVTAGSPGYRKARLRAGIVPQRPGMYPDLTTGEYLALAARLYGVRPDYAVETLGLSEYLNARMGVLSGAFQRRLALAAALIAEPEVLVVDEPTGGLDPVAAQEVHRYLRRAMRDRTTLLCTHNAAEAEALCDEIIMLRTGRVVAHGSLSELRRRSRPRLRMAARQGADVLLTELGGLGVPAEVSEGAVLVSVADVEADAPDLIRRLLTAGVDLYECVTVPPTIEDLAREGSGR